MQIIETPIKDLLVIQPDVFADERGYFMETFSIEKLKALGVQLPTFVQDNESKSQKNVLRGLHFQKPPFAQGKLVRVIKGAVLDIAVDLRRNSSTYGQYYSVQLTEDNKTQFFIPAGFAHGFLTLQNDTIFSYKCTAPYNKESEGGILWNDSDLGIEWGIRNPILSEKDKVNIQFKDFVSPF